VHVQGERFSTMRRLFNDEGTLVRVLGAFGAATRDDLRVLGEAHDRLDLRGIAEVAHKLKSACAQVDDEAAADCLDALEDAAAMGTSPALVTSLVDEATVRVAELADAVDAYVAAHGPDAR
jgi:HPt (histidine-containing phosphotransfer) domain-containing protein